MTDGRAQVYRVSKQRARCASMGKHSIVQQKHATKVYRLYEMQRNEEKL